MKRETLAEVKAERDRLRRLIVMADERFGKRGWTRATYPTTNGRIGYASGVTLPLEIQREAFQIRQHAARALLGSTAKET